ncbi:esterase/lipase family protein [Haloferula chungangensis]|uniref:Esterase/lipase family protein n=1 Tax=Haloferula chungangensis TaxID=1048331 RepID=A0ABW2L2F2_9BACT
MKVTHAVLVHGIWQSEARCFGFLRRDLEARGVEVIVPSLKPTDGRAGMALMAEQLKKEVNAAFGEEQEILLVGFSMGGLVARCYLQDLGGADRCEAFVTISTPHHGTKMAKFHWGKGAAEMRPGSVFLKALQDSESRMGKMPIVSYRTPMDAIVVPADSSVWGLAENICIPCPLHPLMTFSPKLRKDLLKRFEFPAG